MEEHFISVSRSARYYTLGNFDESLREVWFVCHGYGQLASSFLKKFEIIADRRLIIAPEGLSRFYWQGFSGRVAASWMTREDRLHEIEDYVNYLDAVYQQTFPKLNRDSVKVIALGFSQGTATASRWVFSTTGRVDRLILWGGLLPADLNLKSARNLVQKLNPVFVVGKNDEFANSENLGEQQTRLQELDIQHEVISYDGGHEIDAATLKELANNLVFDSLNQEKA